MRRSSWGKVLGAGLAAAWCAGTLSAQGPGTVLREQKISWSSGGFAGFLDNSDRFGRGMAALGDLDGDGVGDLAVGAALDDDGGSDSGAVWILFMNADGTVRSDSKISGGAGGFLGELSSRDHFGGSLACLGDLDGDGAIELAVGADQDDDGGTNAGAVWVLSVDSTGWVLFEQKISARESGPLAAADRFGRSVSAIGDVDGDGVDDLAVGADQDDDGGTNRGAVWILFMNADGTVGNQSKISQTSGGFTGVLDNDDRFGASVCGLGDLDGDGVVDLAAGADQDDDGASASGAVWVLLLNADGTVKAHSKVSANAGLALTSFDRFGGALCSPGDFDGDGVADLVIGSGGDDDGGTNQGAVWIVFLDPTGGVLGSTKVSSTGGNLAGPLTNNDAFGIALAGAADLDGDGMLDLLVGADGDDDGGRDRGAAWMLFLESAPIPDEPEEENTPPTVTCTGGGKFELGVDAVLIGATVADADGDMLSYSWHANGSPIGSGMVSAPLDGSAVELPMTNLDDLGLGEHSVVLTVEDGFNDPVECQAAIKIEDTRAPTLDPTVDPSTLWPANHKMHEIAVTTNAEDASGAVQIKAEVTVSDSCRHNYTRNDPDFTVPTYDAATGTVHLQLRAERCRLHGRTYTIWLTATDGAGNSTVASVDVSVKHPGRPSWWDWWQQRRSKWKRVFGWWSRRWR